MSLFFNHFSTSSTYIQDRQDLQVRQWLQKCFLLLSLHYDSFRSIGVPGEKGDAGAIGPPGRDGEKGIRGKRGKRVSFFLFLILFVFFCIKWYYIYSSKSSSKRYLSSRVTCLALSA